MSFKLARHNQLFTTARRAIVYTGYDCWHVDRYPTLDTVSTHLQGQRRQLLEPDCLHSQEEAALQGRDSVQGYFPAGTWYSLMGGPTVDASEAGRPVTLKAPLGEVPVHVLGGTIIPMQARFWLSLLQRICSERAVIACLQQLRALVALEAFHLGVLPSMTGLTNRIAKFHSAQICQAPTFATDS